MLRIGLNECLWYLVVYILHPTVFSLTDSFKPTSWWWGLTHLEFFTKFWIACTFLFDSFTAYKARLVLAVISGNDKVDTSVDTNNITDIGNITFLDIIRNRDVQKILAMLVYELCSTKLINVMVKVFRHTFGEIWQFNTTVQSIYRKTVLRKGIIPIPNKVILRLFKRWLNPFVLIFKNGLISCDNSLKYRLSHLWFKPELLSERGIQNLVKWKLL